MTGSKRTAVSAWDLVGSAKKKKKWSSSEKKRARRPSPTSPSPSPSQSRSPRPSTAEPYPPVPWIQDRHRLGWKLIRAVQQNERLRRGVWKQPGEPAVPDTKISICTELARIILADDDTFRPVFEAAAAKGNKEELKVARHYGFAVKLRMRNFEYLFRKKEREFGPEGAALNDASEIVPGSHLWALWENIHLDCPYFYELKALIGNRTNFTDQALAEAVAQSAKKYAQQDNRKVAEEEDDQSDEEEEAEEPRNIETSFAHPSSSMTAMGESNGVILVHPYPGAPAECIERWVVKQDLFATAEAVNDFLQANDITVKRMYIVDPEDGNRYNVSSLSWPHSITTLNVIAGAERKVYVYYDVTDYEGYDPLRGIELHSSPPAAFLYWDEASVRMVQQDLDKKSAIPLQVDGFSIGAEELRIGDAVPVGKKIMCHARPKR